MSGDGVADTGFEPSLAIVGSTSEDPPRGHARLRASVEAHLTDRPRLGIIEPESEAPTSRRNAMSIKRLPTDATEGRSSASGADEYLEARRRQWKADDERAANHYGRCPLCGLWGRLPSKDADACIHCLQS